MSKTILLIENDTTFAEETSSGLEAMGYLVRVIGDGKDGLDLAKELRPDAIVLCVELPKLSGYSICNRLKKDDALRTIPLILTSSEATAEVFEDHRKLKVRAEDYLIKPYVPAALVEKLVALIGMPGAGTARAAPRAGAPELELVGADEEVVSLEEDLGLESLAVEPGPDLPALDLDALPDEPATAFTGDAVDDDLKLLDDAFDGLSAPAAPAAPGPRDPALPAVAAGVDARTAGKAIEMALGVDRPVTSEDLEAASASLPEDDESVRPGDLGGLVDEADLAFGSLDEAPSTSAASAFDALDALGVLDEPAAPSPASSPFAPADPVGAAAPAGPDALLQAEAASLKARSDALAAQLEKAEADLKGVREEGRRAAEQAREATARAEGAAASQASAEGKASAAESRCRAAEQEAASQRRAAEQSARALGAKAAELASALASASRLLEVERDVERLETELIVARGEVEGARSEVEKRTADLKRRVGELEAANARNEERVVKAYLKIKGDEKVRDKARKALSIALQLLEEGLPAEPPGEKRPRPVPE